MCVHIKSIKTMWNYYQQTSSNIWTHWNNKFLFITDTDTDFSESEGLSSLQISAPAKLGIRQTDQTGEYKIKLQI